MPLRHAPRCALLAALLACSAAATPPLPAIGDLWTPGDADPDAFQTICPHKRGGRIIVAVDGRVSLAYDDDGRARGPVWTHSGWIGLRRMAHTLRCEYDDLAVFPLR
jgi:hypothetical protein